jgi:alpha-ketoglutarate-dependent taurine dioxygenase
MEEQMIAEHGAELNEGARGTRTNQPVVFPVSETMGAEIRNVDLAAPLTDAAFGKIACAFLDHKLVVFRG